MKIFWTILREKWNDLKIRFKVDFSYRYKKNYSRVKSFVPVSLSLKQGVIIEPNVQLSGHLKSIGKYVYIANNTYVGFCSNIGSFTSISFGVKIGLRAHPLHFISSSPVLYAKRRGWVENDLFVEGTAMTYIGNDVLISANAVILAGVTIGDGAVIAAGAVVNKDVEPYSIVGGVPAKHLNFRFSDDIRKSLLESAWWDMEDEKLKKHIAHFNAPSEFISSLKNT